MQYYFVKAGGARWLCVSTVAGVMRLARGRPIVGVPLFMLLGLPLGLCLWASNRLSSATKNKPPHGVVTSFLMATRVDQDESLDAYAYSPEHVRRDRNRLRDGADDDRSSRAAAGFEPAVDISQTVGQPKSTAYTVPT